MHALVYQAPGQLVWQQVPDPECRSDEVLIKVDSVGICGSDLHAYRGEDERRPPPIILGHEAAGTIVAGANTGQRVTVNPLVTCGKCSYCQAGQENLCLGREIISMPPRQGGFAQFLAIPATNLIAIPEHISFSNAALCEPLACGWHACKLAAGHLELAATTAIIIGGGPIGIGIALCLKAMGGTARILERNPLRRQFINNHCQLETIVDTKVDGKEKVALVFDAVGAGATRQLAVSLTQPGGVIVHVGLGDNKPGIDCRHITLHELHFIGSYTYTKADFAATADAIFTQKLGKLNWIEQRPLAAGNQAFQELLSHKIAIPKIILKPN